MIEQLLHNALGLLLLLGGIVLFICVLKTAWNILKLACLLLLLLYVWGLISHWVQPKPVPLTQHQHKHTE